MSQDGYLELFRDNEGDIIISVINKERKRSSVEFCWSGGYSKNTFKALKILMESMKKDNQENPQN